jgi:hypothetical protein
LSRGLRSPPSAGAVRRTVKTLVAGLPAWKRRNKEPKHVQIMLRASESQRELLQTASEHQEISQQKILEALVWPVLEEQYGEGSTTTPTEGQAPS